MGCCDSRNDKFPIMTIIEENTKENSINKSSKEKKNPILLNKIVIGNEYEIVNKKFIYPIFYESFDNEIGLELILTKITEEKAKIFKNFIEKMIEISSDNCFLKIFSCEFADENGILNNNFQQKKPCFKIESFSNILIRKSLGLESINTLFLYIIKEKSIILPKKSFLTEFLTLFLLRKIIPIMKKLEKIGFSLYNFNDHSICITKEGFKIDLISIFSDEILENPIFSLGKYIENSIENEKLKEMNYLFPLISKMIENNINLSELERYVFSIDINKTEFDFLPIFQSIENNKSIKINDFNDDINIIAAYFNIFQEKKALELAFELKKTFFKEFPNYFNENLRILQELIMDIYFHILNLSTIDQNNEIYKNLNNVLFEENLMRKNNTLFLNFKKAEFYKEINKKNKSIEILREIISINHEELDENNIYYRNITVLQIKQLSKILLFELTDEKIDEKDLENEYFLSKFYEITIKKSLISLQNLENSLILLKKSQKIIKNYIRPNNFSYLNLLFFSSIIYLQLETPQKSLKSILKILSIIKEYKEKILFDFQLKKYKELEIESLKILSQIYLDINEIQKSEEIHKKILFLYEQDKGFYSKEIAEELESLSTFYYSIGNLDKTIETCKIAIETYKFLYKNEKNDKIYQIFLKSGLLLQGLGDLKTSNQFLEASIEEFINKYGGINYKISEIFLNLGENYEFEGKLTLALNYYLKCEFSLNNMEFGIHENKFNELQKENWFRLGNIFDKTGNKEKSRIYFKKT